MAPPLYVKGGVWTNVEDEILKAAIQKYGIYQWERISSLLPKKSAKQVKARWVEYLSPLLNKTDWTKEEDEKLLNLHKIFPNQWRSISNILNRTAVQCVERYQKLIDEAAGIKPGDDEENLGLSGPGIETLPAVGASSGLAVGEMNLNPESKPARPDDEDLPDDEREMLAEAKARLGNIQGKKAKRKARERMLEESKRIALLQKRRELKSAGINVKLTTRNKKKRKEFDYNADIPHEIIPQAGPYDTAEELKQNDFEKQQFGQQVSTKGISMKDIDDRIAKEESRRKKEIEKKKLERKREFNAAASLISEHEDSKRRKLNLPEPGTHNFEKTKSDVLTLTNQANNKLSEKEIARNQNKKRAAVAQLIKATFERLPPPKHETGEILPFVSTNILEFRNDVNANDISDIAGAKLPDETATNVSTLISRVVQRELPIPHPNNLRDLSTVKFDTLVDKLIAEECHRLIRSDYKQYHDTTINGVSTDKYDRDLLEKINQDIDKEFAQMDVSTVHSFEDYVLPKNFKVAESIIENLHTFHNENEKLTNKILESTNYEDQRDQKLQQLTHLWRELSDVNLSYLIEKKLFELESSAIDKELLCLRSEIDKLNKKIETLR